MSNVDERLDAGDERMERIETRLVNIEVAQDSARQLNEQQRDEIRALGDKLDQNSKDTSDIKEIVEMARTLFRFFGVVGKGLVFVGKVIAKVLRWAAPIVVAALAVWSYFKSGGQKP